MVVRIAGRRMYLWRAVDQEGEILDLLIQPRRDKLAGKLLRKHGFAPKLAVKTSCAPVPPRSGLSAWTCRHEQGLRPNNRAENSYQAVGKCPGATLMPRVRR
jgi:transposase-like protein